MFKIFKRVVPAPVISEPIDIRVRSDVNMGDLVRDKVTGFSGVVCTMSHEMDGTIFVGMQPPETEGGKPAEPFEFDIERVEVVTPAFVKVGNTDAVKAAVKIGAVYKDRVSGFVGTCVARVDFLGGCTRVSLRGKVDKDNKLPEPMLVAVERVDIVDAAPAVEVEKRKTPTGGPGKHEASLVRGMLNR